MIIRILLLIFSFFVVFGCSSLMKPIAEPIVQSLENIESEMELDSCETNLISAIAGYRILNNVFPNKQADITYLDTFYNWTSECKIEFDSINFVPFKTDSLDVLWKKHLTDSLSNMIVMQKVFRMKFSMDTLSEIKFIEYRKDTYDTMGKKIISTWSVDSNSNNN